MRTKSIATIAFCGLSLFTSTGCFVYCRSDGGFDEVYTNVGRHSRVVPINQPMDAVSARLERSAGEMGLKIVSKHVDGDETRLQCETPNGRRIKVLVCKEKTGCEVSVRANSADTAVCDLLMSKVDQSAVKQLAAPNGQPNGVPNPALNNGAPNIVPPAPTILPVKAPPPPESMQMGDLPTENKFR